MSEATMKTLVVAGRVVEGFLSRLHRRRAFAPNDRIEIELIYDAGDVSIRASIERQIDDRVFGVRRSWSSTVIMAFRDDPESIGSMFADELLGVFQRAMGGL